MGVIRGVQVANPVHAVLDQITENGRRQERQIIDDATTLPISNGRDLGHRIVTHSFRLPSRFPTYHRKSAVKPFDGKGFCVYCGRVTGNLNNRLLLLTTLLGRVAVGF